MSAPSRDVGGGTFLTDRGNPRQSLNIAQGLYRAGPLGWAPRVAQAGRCSTAPTGVTTRLTVAYLGDRAVDEQRPVTGLPRWEDERDTAVLADQSGRRRADAVDEQTVAVEAGSHAEHVRPLLAQTHEERVVVPPHRLAQAPTGSTLTLIVTSTVRVRAEEAWTTHLIVHLRCARVSVCVWR